MKIVIIDGQGGKMGKAIVEQVKQNFPNHDIYAIGANSIATSVMLKAGADFGATGENPVIVNCADADIVIGPIGIIIANSLVGEITPSMALAVSKSKGRKILLPVNKCNNTVVGIKDASLSDFVQMAILEIKKVLET